MIVELHALYGYSSAVTSTPRLRAASIERDRLCRLVPHADRAELDVRDLHRDARPLADRDRLAQRLEALVRLVADVRHVDAAVARGHLRQLDQLAGFARSRRLRTRDRSTSPTRLRASPCSTSAAICATSSGRAARLKSSPITSRRTVAWPTNAATLTAAGLRRRSARYSPIGHGEPPSGPTTSVVMPCATCDAAAGSPASSSAEWLWMSMKPGATTRPGAIDDGVAALRRASADRRRCDRRRRGRWRGGARAPVPSASVGADNGHRASARLRARVRATSSASAITTGTRDSNARRPLVRWPPPDGRLAARAALRMSTATARTRSGGPEAFAPGLAGRNVLQSL